MTPTAEQSTILDLGRTKANLSINAYAGCGKSSTLLMIERAVEEKPIIYLVFNLANAEKIMSLDQMALERRKVRPNDSTDPATRVLSTTTVRTLNGLGHRIWAGYCSGKITLDAKKTQNIFKQIVDEAPKRTWDELWASYWEVIQGVALAKALGYIPDDTPKTEQRLISKGDLHAALDEYPDDLTAGLIDETLRRSITAGFRGNIDYNDQIYLPALFGGTYPQFPLVLVDEAQDLSPTNHAMLHKLCVRSRLIIVGDRFQNIYSFRGAKAGSMAELQSRYSAMDASLSVSFRCPQAIVENARWRAPDFQWIKPGGHVEILKSLDPSAIEDNGTIICRNNAPLFAVAFKLLAMGRSVNVSGSDIGPKLVALMRKIGPEELSQAQTLSAIDDWLEAKMEKESKSAPDMAECMKVFASHGRTLGEAITYAEHLFAQTGTIRLTTGHKAKGLEWPIVYHLDPWLVAKPFEAEQNLRYVIQTRSQDSYYEINSAQILWP